MKMPYIKMCGFTNSKEAAVAVGLGVDFIGLNFYAESPRAVSFGLATKIQDAVHAAGKARKGNRPARTVGILVNAEIEHVMSVIQYVRPDILQFHGDETARYCRYFRHPYIKAFRIRTQGEADAIPEYLGGYGVGYLVEAYSPVEFGGTGKVLSYALASSALRHERGFLAGGLSPNNVREAVRMLKPYGVDVASGIETRPGTKSVKLMAAFINEVKAAVREASAEA